MANPDHDLKLPAPYLVRLHVNLLGGGQVTCLDAIEALSPEEAKNQAVNYFLLSGGAEEPQAVSFGGTSFYPGVVATVRAEVVAELTWDSPANKRWVDSIKATREWEESLQRQGAHGQDS